MKKSIVLILTLCLALSLSVFALGETEATTYVFETEFTYMENVIGGGISGAAAGLNMIMENAEASNGFYVGSTHSTQCVISYVITSDADTEATLRVILANELSTMKVNPGIWIISVNGESFSYEEFELPAEVKSVGKTFTQFKLGDISLKEGENIISFQVGDNEYCNGAAGGPLFDAMKLTTAADLVMTEYPDNIE